MSAGGRPFQGPASGRFGHKGRKLPAGRCACLASVLSGAGVCLAVWQYIYFSRTCFRVPDVSGFRMKSFPTEGIYGRGLSRIRDLRTQAATDRYGDSVCNQPGTLKYMIASVSVFAGIGKRRCRADSGGGGGRSHFRRSVPGICRSAGRFSAGAEAARHAPSPYRMYDKDGADNVRGNEDRERSGCADCRTGFPACGYSFSAIFSRRFAREPLTSTSRLRIGCSSKYRASASVSAKVR